MSSKKNLSLLLCYRRHCLFSAFPLVFLITPHVCSSYTELIAFLLEYTRLHTHSVLYGHHLFHLAAPPPINTYLSSPCSCLPYFLFPIPSQCGTHLLATETILKHFKHTSTAASQFRPRSIEILIEGN